MNRLVNCKESRLARVGISIACLSALVLTGCFENEFDLDDDLEACVASMGLSTIDYDTNRDGDLDSDELIALINQCESGGEIVSVTPAVGGSSPSTSQPESPAEDTEPTSTYVKAAGAETCSEATKITDAEECRAAGESVGHDFSHTVNDDASSHDGAGRPGGCFWDQNGRSYFNENLSSTATWGGTGGICRVVDAGDSPALGLDGYETIEQWSEVCGKGCASPGMHCDQPMDTESCRELCEQNEDCLAFQKPDTDNGFHGWCVWFDYEVTKGSSEHYCHEGQVVYAKLEDVEVEPDPEPVVTETGVESSSAWVQCAVEHGGPVDGVCSCNGTVRYGKDDTWVYRESEGETDCSNGVFGDPLHGVVKECQCLEPTPEADETEAESELEDWVQCAVEHGGPVDGVCACNGTVRYGKDDTWVYQESEGEIGCNNGVFGDPLFGVVKECQCLEADEPGTEVVDTDLEEIISSVTDDEDASEVRVDERVGNLLLNGSFELPMLDSHTWRPENAISGWNLAYGPAIEVQNRVAGAPFDGEQHVELDSHASSGIYQDVITVPGVRYRLSFAFAARPGVDMQSNQMQALFGDTEVAYVSANGAGQSQTAWQYLTLFVTAEDTVTRIQFNHTGLSTSYGAYIDGVSLYVDEEQPELPTDCHGVPNGPAVIDQCGVCGGSDACLDCSGEPNGSALLDDCGVCEGDGSSCRIFTSCLDWLDFNPGAESGEYVITPDGEEELTVECDMESDGGGWTLIATHDFSEEECVGDWRYRENKGVCRRSGQDPSSASFDTLGLTWSEARFNVGLGSKRSNDAFGYNNRLDWSVEERYVDGISMTTGEEGSREHLFTYALGWPGVQSGNIACPDRGGAAPQAFVGDAYACSAALDYHDGASLFSDDWYTAQAAESSTSAIEIRLMGDESASNENTWVHDLILYVR